MISAVAGGGIIAPNDSHLTTIATDRASLPPNPKARVPRSVQEGLAEMREVFIT
ncbi:hypothetical protein OCU04_008299 [Sclerotinia nivalis]|uniref:Uncharacterized protein n=1 Tax=Sclerotinia nivalis TaxID=352851 RepID=A0A9X0AHU4_9HELO|nr:hypothetical protein OCU04_008299 [Sclerotinia nivalis]